MKRFLFKLTAKVNVTLAFAVFGGMRIREDRMRIYTPLHCTLAFWWKNRRRHRLLDLLRYGRPLFVRETIGRAIMNAKAIPKINFT